MKLILQVKPVNKNFEIHCQDGSGRSHLEFPIGMTLPVFDLQITLILPIKFQVNWPFGSGEEVQNKFSIWWPWQPSWISKLNYF